MMETIIFEINPTVRTSIQDEGNCSPPSWPVRKPDWTKVLGGENREPRLKKNRSFPGLPNKSRAVEIPFSTYAKN